VNGSSTHQTLPNPKKQGIITEDTYAVKFLKGIIEKLKSTRIISRETEIVNHTPANGKGNVCTPKQIRIISILEENVDMTLLFIDTDGMKVENIGKECEGIIGKFLKVRIKIFDQEIEEWITCSTQRKPSEELKSKRRYDKSRLPDHVDEVVSNYSKLINLRSFRDVLEALNYP